MIGAGAKVAAKETVNKRVGVIGTVGTVGSGIHEAYLKKLDPEITVIGKACPDVYKRQEQLTEKPWYSPFPQYQVTERPDRTALELLNGKIALLCDNSPSALILPGAFSSFMESSEDWYHHFEMATFLRCV